MDKEKALIERPRYAFFRHFLVVFIPAVAVVIILLGSFHLTNMRSEELVLEAHELAHVYDGKMAVKDTLQQINTDLLLLANSPILQHYLREPTSHIRKALGHQFLNISVYKKKYDQIRYLDAKGMEIVRVNYNNGFPVLVDEQLLQSKAKRYYFADSSLLQAGAIYVSPLDLNIEKGEIELPYKPMIRLGTPVVDREGKKHGLILLNYFGDQLLDAIQENMSVAEHGHAVVEHASGRHIKSEEVYGSPMVINQEGYWLLGLKDEDEWGFMFGNEQTFDRKYPLAWKEITELEEGQLRTDKGIFSFITIYPLGIGQVSATGSVDAYGASTKQLARDEYSWKLISFIDHAKMTEIAWANRIKTGTLFAAFLFFLLPACLYIARMRYSREQAEIMVQRYAFIVNSSTDLMTLIDSDCRYLAVSKSFCEEHRLLREEILGKTVADIWGQEVFLKSIQAHIEKALAGQQVTYSSWFDTPRSGSRCYDVTLNPLVLDVRFRSCCVLVSRDTTEQKLAQDALNLAKQDWERTFDAVPDLIAILDTQHRFVRVNRAMAEGLGIAPEQCLGRTCYQLVHGTDQPHPNCPHTLLLQDGKVHEAEVDESRIGGEFLVTTSPLHDAEGGLYGSVHVARDIRASKMIQRRLEQLNSLKEEMLQPGSLEEKLKHVTDRVVKIFDADFARIWLLGPGDLCQSCFHASGDDERHVCKDHNHCLHLTVSSGRYTHVDGEVHRRVPFGCYKIGRIASEEESKFLTNDAVHDPRVHDHEWAKSLGLQSFAGYRLVTQETKPIGVFALFSQHNISEEEDFLLAGVSATIAQIIRTSQAEEAVRQGRDSLQAIVDNVDAMIYITDISNYKILMANAYVHDNFGRVEGKCCWQVLQKGQDRPCAFCKSVDPKQIEVGSLDTIVWEVRNTINHRWYECRDRLVKWIDNRPVRIQIATDITERKKNQEKLHELAATQKILLREVNHRVKNNLSALIGMLHMEKERSSKDKYGQGIVFQDLISRIQGLSTVHSLLSAGEWQPISLTVLCREIIKVALATVSHEKRRDVQIEETGVRVGSDQAHHLALVLNELATNSVKHASADTDLIRVEVTIEERGDDIVEVSYRDNGPGYPEEMIAGDMSRANIGVELIQGIVTSNLQGTVVFENDDGALARLRFVPEGSFSKGDGDDR